jgi:hypothetical protein
MLLRIISGCFNFVIHRNDNVILQIPLQNGGRKLEGEGGTTSKWQIMVDKPDTINCTSNQIIQHDYTTLHCLLLSFQYHKRVLPHVISCIFIWKFIPNQMSSGTRTHLGNKSQSNADAVKSLAWRQAGCKGCDQSELHNGEKDAA